MTSFFIWAICSYASWFVIHLINPNLKESFVDDGMEKAKWIGISIIFGAFPTFFIGSAMGLGQ